MAAGVTQNQTQNRNEMKRLLDQDARLYLDDFSDASIWSVRPNRGQVDRFLDETLGLIPPVIRTVEIMLGKSDNLLISWNHPNKPKERRAYVIPHPTMQTGGLVYDPQVKREVRELVGGLLAPLPPREVGGLVYDPQVKREVENITRFVLDFYPDANSMGVMIHECVTMLHQRLTQMEEKSII